MTKKYPELNHVGKNKKICNGAFLKCFSIVEISGIFRVKSSKLVIYPAHKC